MQYVKIKNKEQKKNSSFMHSFLSTLECGLFSLKKATFWTKSWETHVYDAVAVPDHSNWGPGRSL